MSKGNSAHDKIVARLSQAQALILEAMTLLGSDAAAPKVKPSKTTAKKTAGSFDFTTPIRPFVKRHASKMSGPKKFVLLVSYLTQGDESKTVRLSDVTAEWNKMTDKSLLGMKFNLFYTNEAKNNNWVRTPAKGAYQLGSDWKEIFA